MLFTWVLVPKTEIGENRTMGLSPFCDTSIYGCQIESQARRKLATKQFTQRKQATQNSRKIQSQWRAHMVRHGAQCQRVVSVIFRV